MGFRDVDLMAKNMGVTRGDALGLVRMVSSSMERDGMKAIFLAMSENERVNVAEAYAAAEVKRFCEFCMSILTNTEKKSAFDQYLFYKLKEDREHDSKN